MRLAAEEGYEVVDAEPPDMREIGETGYRALMGEGCIPIREIRGWMEAAGFAGWHEVEIFSTVRWVQEQRTYLDEIVAAYRAHG